MAKSAVPIRLLRLEDGFHIFVFARINGKKANLLIDTGASRSAFDKSRLKKFVKQKRFIKNEQVALGLGSAKIESHRTEIESFSLGKMVLKKYTAVLLDLSVVNKSYRQLRVAAVDGVLGSDILTSQKAVIDYGRKKMLIHY